MSEKLQKALADRGLGSRREMERWIQAGRVAVNGERATIGARVEASDRIVVDGQPVADASSTHCRVLVLNKPEGVIVTRRDPKGRASIFDDLPRLAGGRWITVGRLDINTGGLLLLTNSGALANRLMHPSTGIDREYAVRVNGLLEDEALERLRTGIVTDARAERFSDIRYYDGSDSNHWYHVVLMEGRNHEVRRLFAAEGVQVTRLKRVRYGPVALPSWLRRGQRTEMNPADTATLHRLLGLSYATPRRRPNPTRSVLIPYPSLAARSGGGRK